MVARHSQDESIRSFRARLLEQIRKSPGIGILEILEGGHTEHSVRTALKELVREREVHRFRVGRRSGYASTDHYKPDQLPLLALTASNAYNPIIRQVYSYEGAVPIDRILDDLQRDIPRTTCHNRITRLLAPPRPALARGPCPPPVEPDGRRRGCIRLSRQMKDLLGSQERRVSLGIEMGPQEQP